MPRVAAGSLKRFAPCAGVQQGLSTGRGAWASLVLGGLSPWAWAGQGRIEPCFAGGEESAAAAWLSPVGQTARHGRVCIAQVAPATASRGCQQSPSAGTGSEVTVTYPGGRGSGRREARGHTICSDLNDALTYLRTRAA